MATSVDSPSASHITKIGQLQEDTAKGMMASSPLFSSDSERRFWSALRSRVDTLLENRHRRFTAGGGGGGSQYSQSPKESDRAKRMKEDALMLLRGFDSIAYSLSHLSNNLDDALQGARDLAGPPALSEILHGNLKSVEIKQEGPETQKNHERQEEAHKKGVKRKFGPGDSSTDQENNQQWRTDGNLKKAKNLALSMATKAAALARELKSIKSDLCFAQERSALLEEENRRLRDGFSKGIRPEEDDLMRLQMEALLAEKSKLANENANLMRENQCLHQLVEYHQLTSHNLTASYEEFLRGICLDFSSPSPSTLDDTKDADDNGVTQTPPIDGYDFSTSLNGRFDEEQ